MSDLQTRIANRAEFLKKDPVNLPWRLWCERRYVYNIYAAELLQGKLDDAAKEDYDVYLGARDLILASVPREEWEKPKAAARKPKAKKVKAPV